MIKMSACVLKICIPRTNIKYKIKNLLPVSVLYLAEGFRLVKQSI